MHYGDWLVASRAPRLALLIGVCATSFGCGGGGGEETPPTNNTPPTAIAGSNAQAFKSASVTLDGSASSDAEHSALTFQWSQFSGPVVVLSSATAAKPTFTAPAVSGALEFSLIVNDGRTASPPATVRVTVIDRAPSSSAGPDRLARFGTVVTLDARGSTDPDGDALTYSWRQNSGAVVALQVNQDGTATFTAPTRAQVLSFSVQVNDGEIASAWSDVKVSVTATGANTAPLVDAGFDIVSPRRALVTLSGFAFDPDMQAVSVQWRQIGGSPVTLTTSTPFNATFASPAAAADLVFEITATDGTLTATDTVAVTVRNFAPTVTLSLSPTAPKAADPIVAVTAISDPDGDPVTSTYVWKKNGAVLANQSAATLLALLYRRADVIELTLRVSDGVESTTVIEDVTVADTPPVLTGSPPVTVNYGELYDFQLTAFDVDDDPIQLILRHGPAGMVLNANGRVTWTAKLPMFETTMNVHWGMGAVGYSDPLLTGTVRVVAASQPGPLVRTGLTVPTTHHGVVVTDMDGDGKQEIVIGAGRILSELVWNGTTYEQRWVLPFGFDTEQFRAVAAIDVDGDQHRELFFSSYARTAALDGRTRRPLLEFIAPEDGWCEDLVAADLTQDGSVELICLAMRSTTIGRVIVFNARTGTIRWQSPDFTNVRGLTVGNVDGDPALEIIVATGLVYDGGTFANEWTFTSGFGERSLTTADVTGDGVAEIIGTQHFDIVAWDAVSRAERWRISAAQTNAAPVAFEVRDITNDGLAEVITPGGGQRSVTAYRRNQTSGATEVLFTVGNVNEGVSWMAVGDPDRDGQLEVVVGSTDYSGESPLIVIATQGTARVEHRVDPVLVHLGNPFSGARWVQVSAGVRKLAFAAARSGYSGPPRLVTLDATAGKFAWSPTISDEHSGAVAFDAVDFDRDGTDEALVGYYNYLQSSYRVYDLGTNSVEWTTPGAHDFASAITHAELNGDSFIDLVGMDREGYINVYDIRRRALVWKSSNLLSARDVVATDLDGNGSQELIAYSQNGLHIFAASTGPQRFVQRSYTPFDPYVFNSPTDLLVADADGNGRPEIYVLSYSSSIAKFDHTGQFLQTIPSPGNGSTLFLENLSGARKNLVVGERMSGSQNMGASLIAIDANSGAEIWRSPGLLGSPSFSSLDYVDTNNDGDKELTFATDYGMYLTR